MISLFDKNHFNHKLALKIEEAGFLTWANCILQKKQELGPFPFSRWGRNNLWFRYWNVTALLTDKFKMLPIHNKHPDTQHLVKCNA